MLAHLPTLAALPHGQGFNCRILAYDVNQNEELKRQGVQYCSLEELLREVGWVGR